MRHVASYLFAAKIAKKNNSCKKILHELIIFMLSARVYNFGPVATRAFAVKLRKYAHRTKYIHDR